MQREDWFLDRGDISCPACRDSCYFKYFGVAYGDNYIEQYWQCACCGWWYTERNPPLPEESEIEHVDLPPTVRVIGEGITRPAFFFFKLLRLQQALSNHSSASKHDEAFMRAAYGHWLRQFQYAANTFYQRQYVEHLESTFERFKTLAHLDYEFSGEAFDAIHDKGLQPQWDKFSRMAGLDDHDKRYRATTQQIDKYIKQLEKENAIPPFTTYPFDSLESQYTVSMGFDALWFDNVVVTNSTAEQASLRELDYSDYLKTAHWRRIRAAIFCIDYERYCKYCGAKPFNLPRGYSDMHIHHLSYKHLGNERFADVILVCKDCHEKLHDRRGNMTGEKPFETRYF